MTTDFDGVLLDRLFQPASDRFAALTTCFGLARTCLVGAMLLQLVVLAFDLQAEGDVVRRLFAGGITLLALVGADQTRHVIKRAERQSRSGMMNVRRITMRWQRVAWLLVAIWTLTVALGRPDAGNLAVAGASLSWFACIYFIACTPSPPPVARSVRRVAAFA